MVARNFITVPGEAFNASGAGAVERTVDDKLRDVVSVKDFGADSTGVVDSSSAIQTAFNSGAGYVFFPAGTYLVRSSCVVTSASLKRVAGEGVTINVDITTGTLKYAFDFATNSIPVSIEGIVFQGINTDATQTESWHGGTISYNYRAFNGGLSLIHGSTVLNCNFNNLGDALYIAGTISFDADKPSRINGCRFNRNFVSFTGILCNYLEFSQNNAYLGSEVTFPQSRNVLITNNSLFLPGTPAIDVGGGAAVTGSTVTIANNISYGRDAIVVENGFDDIVIDANQCYTMSDSPNGVGIGVTTNTSGQQINRLIISNNRISRYNDPYGATQSAYGIRVRADIDTPMRDVQIESNQISTVLYGIEVQGFDSTPRGNSVSVRNNTIREIRAYGLIFASLNNLIVSGNTIIGDGSVGSSRAIKLFDIVTARLINNVTRTIVTSHYSFEGVNSDVVLDSPDHTATTEATLWEFVSVTGNLVCKNVTFTSGGFPTTGNWAQGSFTLNPVPASAGYYGSVCVAAGTPGTWKNYGLIT
jgi:hypothetical protein